MGFQAEKIYLGRVGRGDARQDHRGLERRGGAGQLLRPCRPEPVGPGKHLQRLGRDALQNGGQLPLAVMLTCVAGRFELPGFTSLGEALLLNENGGMAGGLVPSGAAMHADSLRLGEEFYKAAFRGQGTTAGQALLAAMKNYLQRAAQSYLLNVYNWLGDPALAFK